MFGPWSFWQFPFWYVAVPWAFAATASYVYSDALLSALANAHNSHHRMTPESPWFFFDREFKAKERRILIGAIPGSMVLAWLAWAAVPTGHARGDEYRTEVYPLICTFSGFYGLAMYCLAVVARWAPRIREPFMLIAISLCCSLPGMFIYFMVGFMLSGDAGSWTLVGVIGLAGNAAYFLTWLYIRRKLDRAWFRFDD